MKGNRRIWFFVLLAACFTVGLLIFLLMSQDKEKINRGKSEDIIESDVYSELSGVNSYAQETCYSGKPYINNSLFYHPFRKTDKYISNNEYIKIIGEEKAKIIAERAGKVADTFFHITYNDVLNKSANSKLHEYLPEGFSLILPERQIVKGRDETISLINQWLVENEFTMEAEFQTDKCMVYYDENTTIVRGMLEYTIFECEELDTLQKLFQIEHMELGQPYSIILEMHFIPAENNEDFSSYRLTDIDIVS